MIRGTKSEEEIAELLKDKGARTLEAYVDGLHAEKLEKLKKGKDNNYSIMDDWTIPATDAQGHSVRNQSAGFLVSDINIMPSTCAVDATTQKPAYDEMGHPVLDPMTVAAVKQELLLGHGVQVTFYEPDDDQFPSYLNKQSWSHYTWKAENHNHVVCIVGWDDDYAVGNFNQGTTTEEVKGRTVTYDMAPPGPGAWIVKNSWGRRGGIETKVGGPLGESTRQVLGDCDWGVDSEGFIYLSYYDQSIGNFATYGFMEDKASGSAISHQYDYLCVGFPHMSVGTSRMSAANVFEAEQDESITSVGMTTIEDVYNIRVDYDIYRLREGATTPVDGELLDTVSCLYGYPGYHRERLDAPIALRKGERFSVVVTQSYVDAANGKTTYVISASYWDGEAQARRNGSAYYGKAVVNRGESWAYRDGIWRDWTDVLAVDPKVTKECAVVDNFGIKAFAEPIEAGTYRWTTPDDPTWHRSSVRGLALPFARTEHAEDTGGHVTGVSVDGHELAESDYAISSTGTGATLTLDAGYLAGLATGSHRLEVSLDDADALETTFTVEDAQVAPTQTDDEGGANYPVSYHVYHDDRFYRSDGDHGSDTSGADTVSVRRLFGADRYQTMAAVVADAFDTSGACVVASGTSFADALSAAGLAGALRAPVVLTTPETLSTEAQAQISRLDAKRVYLMGGEAALSPAVEAAVSSLGVEVTRVAGDVRQATSVEAMRLARKEGSAADTVLVASGTGFADALAAGPWPWTKAMPVVLTGQDGLLDEGTLVAIADDAHVRHVIVLGGPSAVADVASQLPAGITCERLGGADRYATAILVADRAAADGLSLTNPYVTSGTGFADALAAGPVAGARGSALLLADPAGTSLASALSGRRDAVRSVTVVGGEAAVSGTAIDALRHTLG